ncbi:glycosyl transferases group 1 domain-containing protein [Hirsutella rhossiliensis]|uniref:Chitobiosyldiphosphodolichol beta-mannosyltransferase n=1 Tax=Hirsutella rhossiliensis TaxID=111463 RepID=A0A9P8N2B4_9HYPO|nr:glycosyl transferases group 1 domain-containing protein [Hirsutella rhossiliensis]KAH0965559.1 glycosyl transferases group 1 domain-containing protein [Hirsutella rhossiliensis]
MIVQFLASVLAGVLFVFGIKYAIALLAWLSQRVIPSRHRPAEKPEDEHVQVLVLGDIGRSPRMQYHAISLAKHGRKVDIVAYKETARHPALVGDARVTMYALAPQPEWIAWGTLPFFINLPAKVILQFWTLFYTLMYATPPAQWIIIQNPPSIPTFHVALLVSLIRGSKVVVDWHNYGYSILAQKSLYRPLVPVYRWYEIGLGRFLGNVNLAVTDAMARELRGGRFNLKSPVYALHDRPAETFQPIESDKEKLAFLSKLPETESQAKDIVDGVVRLVVSSTSWTADEDFGILLDALVSYANPEDGLTAEPPSPILAIITGKGPEKEAYLKKIKQLQDGDRLPGIRILTAWLSNRDYASLLASADLGISLHKSSSGVDLPMKIVDMFGAGLPVAAYSAFESFGELVKEGENGCGFETSAQLADILRKLLSEAGERELAALRRGAVREGSLRWDEEWDRIVAPLVQVA